MSNRMYYYENSICEVTQDQHIVRFFWCSGYLIEQLCDVSDPRHPLALSWSRISIEIANDRVEEARKINAGTVTGSIY